MSTRGADAIEAALSSADPGGGARSFKTVMSRAEGGPDPLDLVHAYEVGAPSPHWHYVGLGLSELGDKTSEDVERSGWGLELTFRLARAAGDEGPPVWPVVLLQKLARYIFSAKRPFGHAHYIAMGGPITKERETSLAGLVFALDPTLGSLDGPNGRLDFVQAIGVTEDELALLDDTNGEGILDALAEATGSAFVVDPARGSLVAEPREKLAVLDKLRAAQGRAREAAAKDRARAKAAREAKSAADREARSAATAERKATLAAANEEHEQRRVAREAAAKERDEQREAERTAREAAAKDRATERAAEKSAREAAAKERDDKREAAARERAETRAAKPAERAEKKKDD